jgi:hypothetical protein
MGQIVGATLTTHVPHLMIFDEAGCFEVCLDQAQKHQGLVAVAMTSGPTTLEALEHTEVAGKMGYDAG